MRISTFVKEHYDELMTILNCVKVGIYIADGESNTILLNDESEKTGGMKREELLGRSMEELISLGYVEESSILRALKSGNEEVIVQALGDGGHLYITGVPIFEEGKPELVVCTERDITETINLKELLDQEKEKYELQLEQLRKEVTSREGQLISESAPMKQVIKNAIKVAKLNTTVMLTGESGTGKEKIASLLHENSDRALKPFFKVNCAAIPENLLESEFFGYEKGSFTGADKAGKSGIFELASGGTLFLDEIGDLPLHMQSKLLRVLQEKEFMRIGGNQIIPVDVRIIAATNINLEKAVAMGGFREDLYYRLNVLPIAIPPLRERKEDITALALHFINIFNKEYDMVKKLSLDGIQALQEHDWPGNVRELRNIIERIMVSYDGNTISRFQIEKQLSHKIVGLDLTEFITPNSSTGVSMPSLDTIMEAYEKKLLLALMENCKTASALADLLGVNKSTISRKLRKYGIKLIRV